MTKNLVLGRILDCLAQIRTANFFFKNLTPSVTRFHGQLSSCTISEKINDLILRKFIDGRTDGKTDRRTRVISQEAVRLMSSVQNHFIVLQYRFTRHQGNGRNLFYSSLPLLSAHKHSYVYYNVILYNVNYINI